MTKERQEQQARIDALTAEIRAILSRYGLADSAQALSQAVRRCANGLRSMRMYRNARSSWMQNGRMRSGRLRRIRMSLRRFSRNTGFPGRPMSS